MIKDQLKTEGVLENKCDSCEQYGHNVQNCPQIHYSVDKKQFCKKMIF